jgi:hypothetical protein
MSGEYLNLRLVDPANGRALYWFCPASVTDYVAKNNLFAADRPGGRGSKVIDKRVYRVELVIQGTAIPSSEMQPDHRAAMQALFGRPIITPRMQIRWLNALSQHAGGAYWLYAYEDRYGAANEAGLRYTDIEGCIYPPVTFDEFRYNPSPGLERIPYMVKFLVGFPRSGGE